jgi:hypothetical protein
MLTEVHEMFETLIKLRSGKFYREFHAGEDIPVEDTQEYVNDFKIVEVTKQRKSKKRGRIVVE